MSYLQFYKKVSFDNPIILFIHSAKKSYANCFINLRQNTKTPLPVESNSKFQDSNLPEKIFMFTKLFSLILIKVILKILALKNMYGEMFAFSPN